MAEMIYDGYAKLYTSVLDPGKFTKLMAKGYWDSIGLWTMGLALSARQMSDGFLEEDDVLFALHATEHALEGLTEVVELWEPVDGGWIIHDYLDPDKGQNSREHIIERRRKDQQRQQRHRAGTTGVKSSPSHGGVTRDSHVSNGQIENLKLKTKKREKTGTEPEKTLSQDDGLDFPDIEAWEPSPDCYAMARELAAKGYPLVDVTDLASEFRLSIQAKGIEHYGYRKLTPAFQSWINKRAKSLRDKRQESPLPVQPTASAERTYEWGGIDRDWLKEHITDLVPEGLFTQAIESSFWARVKTGESKEQTAREIVDDLLTQVEYVGRTS
jgi:hypothetical protein